jgi:Tfp pilus assembly protein PilV
VELIVAIMILGVGVLALAGTAAMVSRQTGGGAQQTIAANVAASRFEELRGRACAQIVSGNAPPHRGMTERWVVTEADASGRRFKVTNFVSYRPAGGKAVELKFEGYVTC